jgi:ABC-type multidrug transport system fused ATPase/permease subunit
MQLRGGGVLSVIRKFQKMFNPQQKRSFVVLLPLTFFSSIIDLFGLAIIIPVVSLVLSPTFYQHFINNEFIRANLPFLHNLDREHLLMVVVVSFFTLLVIKNLIGLYINRKQVKFTETLFVSSSLNVLGNVYRRSYTDLQKNTSNELVNKVTHLQMDLASYAAISIIILINESMIFALTCLAMFIWNWKLSLLLIAALLPTVGLFYRKVKRKIKEAGVIKNREGINLYAKAQEMIIGYTDIKIAGTENTLKARFRRIAQTVGHNQGKADFMMFIPTRIIEIAIFTCILIILLYGIYVIRDSEKIVTTISFFAVIAYRSIPSVNRFAMALSTLANNEFIFNDKEFIYNKKNEEEPTSIPLQFTDKVEFKNVSYRYEEGKKQVLTDCNLTIKKGDKIGIIGKSGAGKSTLVNNILGFLTPTKGEITIDGTILNDDSVRNWWKIVGYVRQEVFIMNASFIENIALGIEPSKIDLDRVKKAVKLASLEELVLDLPDGLDTVLSERGTNLSGGQKQRIAIARAIYKGAEILIFDEATSALDSKTEEDITNAIRELGQQNLTIIIIAHRYTSLKYCNRIYELKDGKISAELTYSDLIH